MALAVSSVGKPKGMAMLARAGAAIGVVVSVPAPAAAWTLSSPRVNQLATAESTRIATAALMNVPIFMARLLRE